MLIVFFFVVLILSRLFSIEATNLKKPYSRISKKHDQTTISFAICLTLQANFRIILPFMKSNGCVS